MARRASDGGANIQLFLQQWHQPNVGPRSQPPPPAAHSQVNAAAVSSSPSQYNPPTYSASPPAYMQTNAYSQSTASFGDIHNMYPQHAPPLSSSYSSSNHMLEDDDEEDEEAIQR